jgi:serine/threonine protein kinase
VLVVMEHCGGGNLFDVVSDLSQRGQRLDLIKACTLMAHAAAGVRVLHAHNPPIAHRDVKLENFVLTVQEKKKRKRKRSDDTTCTTQRTQPQHNPTQRNANANTATAPVLLPLPRSMIGNTG